MYTFFPMNLVPQGLPLFQHFLLPFRPAALPATLSVMPGDDPEDDPEGDPGDIG